MIKQPDSRPVGYRTYRLFKAFRYEWVHEGTRYAIHIPAGFEYDGNSVPRCVWSLAGITPDGLNRAAGLIHDFIYRDCGRLPEGSFLALSDDGTWVPVLENWSRRGVDRMYGRLLREAGETKWKRRMAYRGVRIGGAWPWYTRLIANYFSSVRDFS